MQVIKIDTRDIQMGAVVASGVPTVVGGPYNLMERPLKTWTIWNADQSLALSGVIVQINPDIYGDDVDVIRQPIASSNPNTVPNPTFWHTFDAVTFNNMNPNEIRSLVVNPPNVHRWWRLVATNSNSRSMMVSGWGYAGSAV